MVVTCRLWGMDPEAWDCPRVIPQQKTRYPLWASKAALGFCCCYIVSELFGHVSVSGRLRRTLLVDRFDDIGTKQLRCCHLLVLHLVPETAQYRRSLRFTERTRREHVLI